MGFKTRVVAAATLARKFRRGEDDNDVVVPSEEALYNGSASRQDASLMIIFVLALAL